MPEIPENAPDDVLVRRATSGEAGAFSHLIARHERTALAVAHAMLGDPHAAGDVVQEAFLRAWQRIGTLQDPARFAGWLVQIVRRLATDAVRKNARGSGGPLPADLATTADPAADLARRETAARLDAALAGLDEVSRSVVTLRYFAGLPSRQIAELLALSPAAVDMRLSRAREALRQQLAPAEARK